MTEDDAVRREVLNAARQAFVPMPDTRVVDRPDWVQLVTPSLPRGPLNEVSLAVVPRARVDAVIDATLAEYRDLGLNFRWTIGPDSAPADLPDRLRARGFEPESGLGVARRIETADGDAMVLDPAIAIESVDRTNIDAFTDVMVAGWGADRETLSRFHERILTVAADRLLMQLARVDGAPAAAAAVSLGPSSAYLMGAVVLPEYRGRGIYRALIAHRTRVAARRGAQLLVSHARAATSAPVLLRLGFREVCRLTAVAIAPD